MGSDEEREEKSGKKSITKKGLDENEDAIEEEEEEEEDEDDEGNVIKRKKVKGPLDIAGIDEKLRTVGRGVHRKFNDEFHNLTQPKITKKKKESKKNNDEAEPTRFFDFDMAKLEKTEVLGSTKQKKTIKDYKKDSKFVIDESDHLYLEEKYYDKVFDHISFPFTVTEPYLLHKQELDI